jgi:hypothetical protein
MYTELVLFNGQWYFQKDVLMYEGVSKSFRTESITKYTLTFGIARWEATQRVYGGKTR